MKSNHSSVRFTSVLLVALAWSSMSLGSVEPKPTPSADQETISKTSDKQERPMGLNEARDNLRKDKVLELRLATENIDMTYGWALETLAIPPELRRKVRDRLIEWQVKKREQILIHDLQRFVDDATRSAALAQIKTKTDADLRGLLDEQSYNRLQNFIEAEYYLNLVAYNDAKICAMMKVPLNAEQYVALALAEHRFLDPEKNPAAKQRFTTPLGPMGLTEIEEKLLRSLVGTLANEQLFIVRNRLTEIQIKMRRAKCQ